MRGRVANSAKALCGIPFRHQGRNPEVGLDCAGVVWAAFRACGVDLEDVANYRDFPSHRLLGAMLVKNFGPLQVRCPRPGDVLHLMAKRHGKPRHLAVATSPATMVHVVRGGLVTEEPIWLDRLCGIYWREGGK